MRYEIRQSDFHGGGAVGEAATVVEAFRLARESSCGTQAQADGVAKTCGCGGESVWDVVSGRLVDPMELSLAELREIEDR